MYGRILLLLPLVCALRATADETKKPYGFSGFEIYKLEPGISGLTACDADADGLEDLLLINNTKAKIEVLLRRRDPVPPKTKTGEVLPNDLVDDRFFERKEILTEKQVWALTTGDLNGDGKLDVAYYGKPEELVVAYGDGKGAFGKTKAMPIEDVRSSPNGLATGDLNGDGRADLAMLGKEYTALHFQTDKGELAEPVKVPHAVKGVTALDILDLDGDQRADLVYYVPASPRSVRVRFQAKDGNLGPEVAYRTSAWRVIDMQDIAPTPGAEILVVQRTSGILRSLRATAEPSEGALPVGTAQVHAFQATRGGKPRSMAIADIDGDRRVDVVVTEPGTAQVSVYLQGDDGRLRGRRTFPSLSDSSALRMADLNGDGRAEVVVLASGERAVGVSSLSQDLRMPFPEMLALDGAVPKALDVGDLDGDGKADVAVVVEKDKKRSALLFHQGEKGLAEKGAPIELAGLKNAPDDLMIMDLDQDGHNDLLLFDLFGPVRLWLADGKGGFAEHKTQSASALLNKLGRGNVGLADVDGDGKPELLITSKNFARAVVLDRAKGLRIKDQANGRSSTSLVKGVTALDLDGDGKAEVALFDREKNLVTVLKRGEGDVFSILGNLEVGELDFLGLYAADINGDKREDLVVFGKNRFAVMYAGGVTHKLEGVHSIESTVRDASLGGFDVGDLNGDGKPDIAILDSGNLGIQVFSYDHEKGFEQHLSWPIYQKKMHEQRRRGRGGAREIVVTDLNGDGLDDIALIVHDRLIVYPQ